MSFPSVIILKCLQLLPVWMKASGLPNRSHGSQHQERTFTYSASILMQQAAGSREFLIMLQGILLFPAGEDILGRSKVDILYVHHARTLQIP